MNDNKKFSNCINSTSPIPQHINDINILVSLSLFICNIITFTNSDTKNKIEQKFI